MKRIITIIFFLAAGLFCAAGNVNHARGEKGGIKADKLASLISEYSGRDGFEVMKIGRMGTSVLKALARFGGDSDESRELKKILGGIRRLEVVDYDDCSNADKEKFERRLGRLLIDEYIILEIKDGGDTCGIYGVVDDVSDKLSNFVLYNPSDCTLICLFGTIPMSAVASVIDA